MKRAKSILLLSLFLLPIRSIAANDVVAVDSTGAPVVAGKLLETGSASTNFIDQSNMHIKMAPFSVAEFSPKGEFHLLRGSAVLDTELEKHASTAGAGIGFVGKLILSFDHKEKSTSAFVITGQARLENPFQNDHTVIVDKNHGATMVVGEVYPSLLRQLDLASLDTWLAGYAWSKEDRAGFTQGIAALGGTESPKKPETKASLQDYYGTLNVREERPEYYEKKFGDPDKVMADAAQKKNKEKELTPEEAALISLPSTKVDTDMGIPVEFLSSKERQAEIFKKPEEAAPTPERKIASVAKPKLVKVAPKKPVSLEPEVDTVVERLRSIASGNQPAMRAPSSVGASPAQSGVPDPVYDFSQNF